MWYFMKLALIFAEEGNKKVKQLKEEKADIKKKLEKQIVELEEQITHLETELETERSKSDRLEEKIRMFLSDCVGLHSFIV